MKHTHLIVALIGLLLMACNNQPQKQNLDKMSQNAEVDLVEDLNKQIVKRPNDPNLYIKRAYAYRNKNMMALAFRDVERALAIDSTVSYFHYVMGDFKFRNTELRDARLSLEKAVHYDPSNTDAILKLAEANFLLRRYDEAMTYTNDALRINDKLSQAYLIKGFIYKELGDTTLARSSFHTATEVYPDNFEAFMELGLLSAYQGDPIAIEYFTSALEIKPKSAEAWYSLGMFYQAGEKYDKAMETYRKLLDVDPNNFLAYYNTGYLYLTEYGEFQTAMAYFDSVIAIEPSYIDAIYNKGVCYEELNQTNEAIAIYESILEVDPDYTLAARGLDRLN